MVAHLQGEEGLGWFREKMSGKFGEGRQWAKRRPVRLIAENLCSPYPTFPIWLNIPLSKSSAFFKSLSICETLAVGMAIITP